MTCTVPDLNQIESAYIRFLEYHVVEFGEVPREAAESWGAPAVAGRRYLTLAPDSGEPVHLRFIESASAVGWRALTTHGWNAMEIVVQDVDALAARLAGSPFRPIGGPKSLQRFPMIRAMQVLGPAGECLYFTQIGPDSGLDLAEAKSFVGRVFIVVSGGRDLKAMFAAYSQFANKTDPPVRTRVEVISRANDLPLDTEHPHGLIRLPCGTMIELDGYPDVTTPRQVAPGELPPGMAIVSFDCSEIDLCASAGSCARALLPCAGRAAILKGAAGELIELVESVATPDTSASFTLEVVNESPAGTSSGARLRARAATSLGNHALSAPAFTVR